MTNETDRDYLINVCKGLEELRINNKTDIRQSQFEAFKEVNKSSADLNKHFFALATLLVPAIFTLASLEEVRKLLAARESGFLTMSLIFLLISLFVGIIHMVSDKNFYLNWFRGESMKLKLWSSKSFWPRQPTAENIMKYYDEYEETRRTVETITSQIETESTEIWLILQGMFLLLGIILVSIVAIGLLP